MTKIKCDFCGEECDGKLILRDTVIEKKDGSDIILCSECLNNYANGEYDKIKLKELKDIFDKENSVALTLEELELLKVLCGHIVNKQIQKALLKKLERLK